MGAPTLQACSVTLGPVELVPASYHLQWLREACQDIPDMGREEVREREKKKKEREGED